MSSEENLFEILKDIERCCKKLEFVREQICTIDNFVHSNYGFEDEQVLCTCRVIENEGFDEALDTLKYIRHFLRKIVYNIAEDGKERSESGQGGPVGIYTVGLAKENHNDMECGKTYGTTSISFDIGEDFAICGWPIVLKIKPDTEKERSLLYLADLINAIKDDLYFPKECKSLYAKHKKIYDFKNTHNNLLNLPF